MYSELSNRKKDILKTVVEMYIESGGPVGSKMLTEHGGLSVSPATVRNELSELTDMGYLVQPHTSAGRIPSEQAYRFYVDYLMSSYNETSRQITDLNELMKLKSKQLDKIIDDAGKLAGTLTNLPAISVFSGRRKLSVKKFSIMQNDPYSFIILMLIAKNNVRSRTINTSFELSEEAIF
ncbi:MAG: heat-inducible transcription repressor HrcA, partial [Clostridia bacterium]|nr:heat-inducible transcription repressor HrcA [Clostridia bacterium]